LSDAEVAQCKEAYQQARQALEAMGEFARLSQADKARYEMYSLQAELALGQADGRLGKEEMAKYRQAIEKLEVYLKDLDNNRRESVQRGETAAPGAAGRPAPPARTQESYLQQMTPAQAALVQFNADSPNPQVNDLRREILLLKAELESGRLAASDAAEYQEKIKAMEAELSAIEAR
jgi:hypothetical protein